MKEEAFHGLGHARAVRDRILAEVVETIREGGYRVDEAKAEGVARKARGWRRALRSWEDRLRSVWFHGGCAGPPPGGEIDRLKAAVRYVAQEERRLVGKEALE